MVGSAYDRCRVYILCRPIFSGANARLQKLKKVKRLVNKSRESLRPLLQAIGEDKLVEILRSLLKDRIFESELRAKIEFPDLFRPSANRNVQRLTSEADAARSTAEVLDAIVSRDGEPLNVDDIEDSGPEEVLEPDESAAEDGPCGASELRTEKRLPPEKPPSLYPSYLPYRTQHLILNTTQQVLEECCFDFATVFIPSVLQEKRWECAAAAELTQWIRVFSRKKHRLQKVPINFDANEVQGLFKSMSNLRHTAVHRLPTTARGINQLLESAVKFARVLQDDLRAAQLGELQSDVNSKIKAMELNKDLLEDTVSPKLQEIQRQREELDRMEGDLIQGMLKDDIDNKTLIGQLLEDSVRGIFSLGKEAEKEEEGEKEDGEKEDGDERNGEKQNEETDDPEEREERI